MRKLIAIGMALCVFAVLISSASACIMGPDGKCVGPDQIDTKPNFVYGDFKAGGTAATLGAASADGYCPTAQVSTNTGIDGSSVFSTTNAAAQGWNAQAGAAGGSSAGFTFDGKAIGK